MSTAPLVVDIEANGLLEDGTVIWCIVAKALHINKWMCYCPKIPQLFKDLISSTCVWIDDIGVMLKALEQSEALIFHNGYLYDVPYIQRFYRFTPKHVEDTFILSSLFEPDRVGGHSLNQYGQEIGLAKKEHEDWSHFSIEMLCRCFRDVEITEARYYSLTAERSSWDWEQSIRLEYAIAKLCAQMQLNGVLLDQEKARETLKIIQDELDLIDQRLQELIPKQVVALFKNTPVAKPFKKDGSYSKMVTEYFKDEIMAEQCKVVDEIIKEILEEERRDESHK